MNITTSIVIGVISGILTSFVLFIIYKIKEKVFNPWLENRLYKGVVLEGSWLGKRTAVYSEKDGSRKINEELKLSMQLKQKGYNVFGIFSAESLIKEKDGTEEKYQNLYNIKGHIQDNYVVLEYCPMSRKRTGLGVFIMEVKNGGSQMKGDISFVEESNMEIMTLGKAILNRNSEK